MFAQHVLLLTLGLCLTACSSDSEEGSSNSSLQDAGVYDPCEGKVCGEICNECPDGGDCGGTLDSYHCSEEGECVNFNSCGDAG